MEKITKKQFYASVTILTIIILILTYGIWLDAKSIFDGSYPTIIKIFNIVLCVAWGGSVSTVEYLTWSWKKQILKEQCIGYMVNVKGGK